MRLVRPLSLVAALSLIVGACSDTPTTPLSTPANPPKPRLDCSGLILSVSISGPSQIKATKDGQYTLSAQDRDGCSMSTVGHAVTWSVTPSTYASISASTQADATVHGIATGTVTVRATVDGIPATMTVSIIDAPYPASVSITPNPASTAVGGNAYFTATSATDQYGDSFPTNLLSWSSSNASIATINASTGVATGVARGTVTISATAGGHGSSVQLSIVPAVTVTAPDTVTTGTYTASATVNPSATYYYTWWGRTCGTAGGCSAFTILAQGYGVTSVTRTIQATDISQALRLDLRDTQSGAVISTGVAVVEGQGAPTGGGCLQC